MLTCNKIYFTVAICGVLLSSSLAQNSFADKREVERENAQTLVKQVSNSLQNGANKFFNGVEHFVVGLLGAINNVNTQNAIEEAFKNTEKETTPSDYEEEETTFVPTTIPTTVRTTSVTTKKYTRFPKKTTTPKNDLKDSETTKKRYQVRVRDTTPAGPSKFIIQQFQPLSPLYQASPNGQYAPIYNAENPIFQAVRQPGVVDPAIISGGPVVVPVVYQPLAIKPPPGYFGLRSNETADEVLITAAPVVSQAFAEPAAPTKKPNPLEQFTRNRLRYTVRPKPKPKPIASVSSNFQGNNLRGPLLGTVLRPSLDKLKPVVKPVQVPVAPVAVKEVPVIVQVVHVEATTEEAEVPPTTNENIEETTEDADESEADNRRSL